MGKWVLEAGCASSAPAAASEEQQKSIDEPKEFIRAAPAPEIEANAVESEVHETAKAKARRLSVANVDPDGNVSGVPQTMIRGGTPPGRKIGSNGPRAPAAGDVAASTKGRARRLSYISNDPNGTPAPILAPGAIEAGDDYNNEPIPSGPALPGGVSEALALSVACMSRAGREPGFKKTNQDNCFAFEKYISEEQSLFGAMDGHGPHGHLVSGYVKQHLPIILVNHLTAESDPKKALSSGFIEVDTSLGSSRIDCEFSGSTCVVSYLKGTTLTTAWVGDSRGVMARETSKGLEAIDLTIDHKPTDPEEKTRILRSNGRVERLVDEVGQPMGPHRVWLQYAWIPGLAMSRALGDVLAHQVGVSSEPQHSVHEVIPEDKFFILASDGVWEFITSQEAVDIVGQCDSTEEACRQLVDEAYQRWLTEEEGVVDDITAVVVRFLHKSD
eukprot:gene12362-15543_t